MHFGYYLEPIPVSVGTIMSGAKSITASPTGSPLALRQLLQFAARKNIAPQIELFPMSQLNEAIERLRIRSFKIVDIRYRIVLKADFD